MKTKGDKKILLAILISFSLLILLFLFFTFSEQRPTPITPSLPAPSPLPSAKEREVVGMVESKNENSFVILSYRTDIVAEEGEAVFETELIKILVSPTTEILAFKRECTETECEFSQEKLSFHDIMLGDRVTIIGQENPNSKNEIFAERIRVIR